MNWTTATTNATFHHHRSTTPAAAAAAAAKSLYVWVVNYGEVQYWSLESPLQHLWAAWVQPEACKCHTFGVHTGGHVNERVYNSGVGADRRRRAATSAVAHDAHLLSRLCMRCTSKLWGEMIWRLRSRWRTAVCWLLCVGSGVCARLLVDSAHLLWCGSRSRPARRLRPRPLVRTRYYWTCIHTYTHTHTVALLYKVAALLERIAERSSDAGLLVR